MDLLARKRMLFVLILLAVLMCLGGDTGYGQTYVFQKVEYFPVKTREEKKSSDIVFSMEELWQSPKIAYEFLTNPSFEAAQKYLLWQKERLKHLQNAMNLLNQIAQDP